MEKEAKTILGIAFLTTIIISVFSLLGKISEMFQIGSVLENGLNRYSERSAVWIIVTAVIIIVLYWLNKKINQDVSAMLRDKTIRTATSLLVLIDGAINLLSSLHNRYMNINSFLFLSKQPNLDANINLAKCITIEVISAVIVLCQILFAVYWLRTYKNKTQNIDLEQ